MPRKRHPIDSHVGMRLRLCRTLRGWSQEQLAAAVGLTFQQIQKYEKGTNRIGCGRLYEFANVLDVPTSYFFDDLPASMASGKAPPPAQPSDPVDASLFIANAERARRDTLELVRAYETLASKRLRRTVLKLVQSMRDEAPGATRASAGAGARRRADLD